MEFKFDSDAVSGNLTVNPGVQVLKDDTANAVLILCCAFARRVPIGQINDAIRQGLRAESIGPILHPEAWMAKDAFRRHSTNLDILRRFEDFRRALMDADEALGVDPHALEAP